MKGFNLKASNDSGLYAPSESQSNTRTNESQAAAKTGDIPSDRPLNRKLAAIFYTDAVGYSRLTGKDEDSTFLKMNEYLEVVSDAVAQHQGSVIHYAGDAVLADFSTVTAALKCAVFVRDELNLRNQALPDDKQVWFRTGVNLGEVVCEENRIFGDGVNVAARLESLADPGGICISESARSAIGNKLELRYDFMGEQSVKNIERPIRAYRVLSTTDSELSSIPCPYPGMVPFSAADSAFFCGRDDEITRMVTLLRKQRFLMLIGPSGSGKSSLLYAGLFPALQKSRYFGQQYWLVQTMRPGANPVQRLHELLGTPNGVTQFNSDAIDNLLKQNPGAKQLLLLVDQFEEIFIQPNTEERTRFIDELLALRAIKNIALILTFRADFYPDLMNSYLWPVDISERVEVAPLKNDALRLAIIKPAAEVNVQIKDDLLNQLMIDAANEPGALPLLQETMSLLWDEMDNRTLTLEDYQQLSDNSGLHHTSKSTGLAVAIAMKADRTLQDLSLSERSIARRIFLRLIQFGEGRADTRRQQPINALRSVSDQPGELEHTLEHLTNNRLLTRSGGDSDQPSSVDISHESLINCWTRLQEWADERREAEQIRRRLEGKAKEWVRLGQRSGGLLSDAELPEADHWLASADAKDLGYDEKLPALVLASKEALELASREREALRQQELQQAEALTLEQQRRIDEQSASARKLRRSLAGLVAVLTLAVGAGGFAWIQSREANAQRIEAQASEQKANQLAAAESIAREIAEQRRVEAENARLASVAQLLAIQVPDQQASFHDEKAALLARQAYRYSKSGSRQLRAEIDSVLRKAAGKPYFSQILNPATTYSVAISADGKYLAAVHAAPNQIVIWDLTKPDLPVKVLEGYPGKEGLFPVRLTFALNGKVLLAASPDGSILQWQLDKANTPVSDWPKHDGGIWSLTSSPDGRWLAIGSKQSNSFTVHDLRNPGSKPVVVRNQSAGELTAAKTTATENAISGIPVTFSPDSTMLASGGLNGAIRLWSIGDFSAPVTTLQEHNDNVLALAFSNDGKQLASSAKDNTIRVWDIDSPVPAATILTNEHSANSLDFLNDDSAIVSADIGIKIWPLNDIGKAVDLSAPSIAYSVVVSPDGKSLATGGGNGASGLSLWDLTNSGIPTLLKGHKKLVLTVAYSNDGKLLASGGNPADRSIRIWDTENLQADPLVLPEQKGATNSLQFSHDNRQLLTTSWNTSFVGIWNLDTTPIESEAVSLPGTHKPWRSIFSPDEKQVLITGSEGIYRWNSSTPTQAAELFIPTDNHMFGLISRPDRPQLAASGFGGSIFIKDLSNVDAPPAELKGHTPAGSRTLDYSADGRYLASGGQDGSVRLWDPESPQTPSTVIGYHDDAITRIRFSPDGKTLASTGLDRQVRIWNLQDRDALPIVLSGFDGPIYGLDYHPDGHQLVAAGLVGADGAGVKVWDLTHPLNHLSTAHIADTLCGKVRRNLSLEEWNNFVGDAIPYERTCNNLPVHPSVIDTARELAQSGSIEDAQRLLERALELDPDLALDPANSVAKWTAPAVQQ